MNFRLDAGPLTVHRWFDMVCTGGGTHRRNRLTTMVEVSLAADAPTLPWPSWAPPPPPAPTTLLDHRAWCIVQVEHFDPKAGRPGRVRTTVWSDDTAVTDGTAPVLSARVKCPVCGRDLLRKPQWWAALQDGWPADTHEFDISGFRD